MRWNVWRSLLILLLLLVLSASLVGCGDSTVEAAPDFSLTDANGGSVSLADYALAFAPGECAQVDWGHYGSVNVGNTRRRLSFFVMVLCHSRLMYLEFTVSQTMEHFLACHQHAFEFFGRFCQGNPTSSRIMP